MNSSAFMDNLKQLFAECDTDRNGSLGRDEFSLLCTKIGLNKDAAQETFDRLDVDKDDRITFDEFAAGFNQYSKQVSPNSRTKTAQTTTGRPASANSYPSDAKTLQTSAKSSQRSANNLSKSSSPTANKGQKLSPGSPLSRKSASPLGVLSLSSTDSSGNLASGSSETNCSSVDGNVANTSVPLQYDPLNSYNGDKEKESSSMVVYSSDNIGDYNDQASGSGSQFGSLMSSAGSFNQVRTMQDLLDCVQKLQSENQTLTQIFFKDKREREEYISQLGEEFDQQVREVEERANRRAKEELEAEKKRLREMMQAERETLQHHYQTIEKMSKIIKTPQNGKLNENGESIDKVRSKLEDTFNENKQLKKSLLDTKTDVAMIWKEMERLKRQYEDKLSSAYERSNETKSECDHIKQQLNLMKDSNRKLQDASDVITSYITDKVEPVISGAGNEDEQDNFLSPNNERLGTSSQNNSRRGSILSEYLNDGCDEDSGSTDGIILPARNSTHQLAKKEALATKANRSAKTSQNHKTSPSTIKRPLSIGHHLDSTESDQLNLSKSLTCNSINEDSDQRDNIKQLDKDVRSIEKPTPKPKASIRSSIGKHFFIGSRTQSEVNVKDEDSKKDQLSKTSKAFSVDNIEEVIVEPADGPSVATFNIILVGDSFVGKSSFAARFIEGSFVQGLISNCSIDFKTKAYKVDGINYTVNLWDTAGQERFRSITASYFRKADGIILMYDVTDKRSYLNVRNWMSTISDTAAENVAVLLVGNKIDLRNKNNMSKCVPLEEGFGLAREYGIVFLETSVKTGANLVPSMGKLIRLIAKNNCPQEEDLDRIRLNDKNRTFKCMPKSC